MKATRKILGLLRKPTGTAEVRERTLEEVVNDPRLDDEGTYDYYAEDLPQDYARWEKSLRKEYHCESCGKYRRAAFCQCHHFYCWDGWDSMSYTECWHCVLKDNLRGYKRKIKSLPLKARRFVKAVKIKSTVKEYTWSDAKRMAKYAVKQ